MRSWEKLRALLKQRGGKALIIPHTDEWQNEYLAPSFERLAFATGFTGSAGCAVIGLEKAVLLTDGRYTLQAESQLDSSFFEIAHNGKISITEWVQKNIGDKQEIWVDPKCHSVNSFSDLNLKFMEKNWIDEIWENRPEFVPSEIFDMNPAYIDLSFEEKKQLILEKMTTDVLVLTAPESICWLMNKRGKDIQHTPIFLSFALLEKSGAFHVFLGLSKEFENALKNIQNQTVSIDPARCSLWIEDILKNGQNTIIQEQDPCVILKACKTASELNGMREAHRLDAIAMIEFLSFLDEEIQTRSFTEVESSDILESYRAKEPTFLSLSFATISGSDANGAIIHYKAHPETCGMITKDSVYLLDSGGQYASGTTDITRTMAFGKKVSEDIKNAYTAVLKGVIHLSSAKFPKGTTGHQLDALARYFLWQQALDYDHGTGHGVGAVLSVHEGPQGISPRPNPTPLSEGMVVSIEPGYYQAGFFGIRIENLAIVVPCDDHPNYLKFETLTLVPIDQNLINFELLQESEINWLKAYHERVLKEIERHLSVRGSAFLQRSFSSCG